MKKVNNRKMYNTETAKCVGYYDNGLYSNDFGFYKEKLYCKKTGEYFLYGAGGGNSKYAEYYGNSRSSGEEIIPLSISEAQDWAETHLDGDEYEEIFGDPEPECDKECLNLYVSKQTLDLLQRVSKERNGLDISSIIEELVNKGIYN